METKLLEDLFHAYYDARRNKRNTDNQLKFEIQMEAHLLRLHEELASRTYRVGRSVAFIVDEPVLREVFAADFADRVVHHLYFNYVNEIFERSFIADSYSCRKGRGTSAGVERLDHHIRSCSENYARETWVLKLDLSGYFMSINRQILHDKIVTTLNKYASRRNAAGVRFGNALDYDLLKFLTREIVFADPVDNCIIKGSADDWADLPPDKSLFHSADGCGLPIGNLTSQLFSNVYLNDFDHWVKRELKVKHYGRYVDDFYLVHNSREFLAGLIEPIRAHLADNLGIKLHPDKIFLQRAERGVTYLGKVVKPHRTYVSKRTASNFKRAMAKGEKFYRANLDRLRSTLNSYLGLMIHYKTFRLRQTIVGHLGWINRYGFFNTSITKMALISHRYTL